MHSALRIPGHDPGHGTVGLLITECYRRLRVFGGLATRMRSCGEDAGEPCAESGARSGERGPVDVGQDDQFEAFAQGDQRVVRTGNAGQSGTEPARHAASSSVTKGRLLVDDQPDCGSLDRPPDAVQIDGVEGCEGAYPAAAAATAPQFAIANQGLNGYAYCRQRGAAAGEIVV
jgi:hypothetical protein